MLLFSKLYVCVCEYPEKLEGMGFPGAGVTHGCELPYMGTGNQVQVVEKATWILGH